MIILHAGYVGGFIPGAGEVFKAHSATGDYHGEMNHQTILKWLNKVIPNLPPKSVLVMDNAPYHNVQVDRPPVRANKKVMMQEWLTRHMVPWDAKMFKDELHTLIKKHTPAPVYVVDQIPESHGHLGLRLPPYHADLNPIELIWGNLKGDYFRFYTIITSECTQIHNVLTAIFICIFYKIAFPFLHYRLHWSSKPDVQPD